MVEIFFFEKMRFRLRARSILAIRKRKVKLSHRMAFIIRICKIFSKYLDISGKKI